MPPPLALAQGENAANQKKTAPGHKQFLPFAKQVDFQKLTHFERVAHSGIAENRNGPRRVQTAKDSLYAEKAEASIPTKQQQVDQEVQRCKARFLTSMENLCRERERLAGSRRVAVLDTNIVDPTFSGLKEFAQLLHGQDGSYKQELAQTTSHFHAAEECAEHYKSEFYKMRAERDTAQSNEQAALEMYSKAEAELERLRLTEPITSSKRKITQKDSENLLTKYEEAIQRTKVQDDLLKRLSDENETLESNLRSKELIIHSYADNVAISGWVNWDREFCEGELRYKDEELAKVNAKLDKLQQELSVQRSESSEKERSLGINTKQLATAKSRTATLEQRLRDHEEEFCVSRDDSQKKDKWLDFEARKAAAANSHAIILEQRVMELEEQLLAAKAATNAEVALKQEGSRASNTALAVMHHRLCIVESALIQKKITIQVAVDKESVEAQEKEGLRNQLSTLKDRCDGLDMQLSNSQRQLDDSQIGITAMTEDRNGLNARLSSTHNQWIDTKNQLRTAEEQLSGLEDKIHRLVQQEQDLQAQIREGSQRFNDLKDQLSMATSRLQVTEQEYQHMVDQLEVLKDQVSTLTSERDESRAANERLEATLTEYEQGRPLQLGRLEGSNLPAALDCFTKTLGGNAVMVDAFEYEHPVKVFLWSLNDRHDLMCGTIRSPEVYAFRVCKAEICQYSPSPIWGKGVDICPGEGTLTIRHADAAVMKWLIDFASFKNPD